MKPHIRLRYLGAGIWFADLSARRGDPMPLMFTRFAPQVPQVLRECRRLWQDWQTITNSCS